MKVLNVTFENAEWDRLNKARGELTWRKFLLKKCLENDR